MNLKQKIEEIMSKKNKNVMFTKQTFENGQTVYRNALGHFVSPSLVKRLKRKVVKVG